MSSAISRGSCRIALYQALGNCLSLCIQWDKAAFLTSTKVKWKISFTLLSFSVFDTKTLATYFGSKRSTGSALRKAVKH